MPCFSASVQAPVVVVISRDGTSKIPVLYRGTKGIDFDFAKLSFLLCRRRIVTRKVNHLGIVVVFHTEFSIGRRSYS